MPMSEREIPASIIVDFVPSIDRPSLGVEAGIHRPGYLLLDIRLIPFRNSAQEELHLVFSEFEVALNKLLKLVPLA
jgi:hypothetical protein